MVAMGAVCGGCQGLSFGFTMACLVNISTLSSPDTTCDHIVLEAISLLLSPVPSATPPPSPPLQAPRRRKEGSYTNSLVSCPKAS